MRCRIFHHTRAHELEREVNEFLKAEKPHVRHIAQSTDAEGTVYLTLLYEPTAEPSANPSPES